EEREPGLGLLDALMSEDRQSHGGGLAEDREEDRVRKPRRLFYDIVDADAGEHGLDPAPPHEDDDIRRNRQPAALGPEGSSGDRHGRQARTRADVADQSQHNGAHDRAENDDENRSGE